MYLAGVSVRRVEDITEALWGTKVSPGTISNLNKKAYENIEKWRNRPLSGGSYPYVYVDGIFLKRCWGGEFENVSNLVAIGVNEDVYREIIGAAEGLKEDIESWKNFLVWLKERGLDGVKLVVGDKAAAREKANAVITKLREMKLSKAADKVESGIDETLTYMSFPAEHWTRIRTNNTLERINREIKRRTKVVGSFPDGESALMLVYARLRHVTGSEWGSKRYLNMEHLTSMLIAEAEGIA